MRTSTRTGTALRTLALTAPKYPVKGRGNRRIDFTAALRGDVAMIWGAIPASHKDEVGEKVCGGFKFRRVVSLEAARKLGLKIAR